jgi:ADP-ribosylglycohydrolase
MYGAILGDIFGSIYEFNNRKTDKPDTIDLLNPRCYYTDDTVMTIATAEAALGDRSYAESAYVWGRLYPHAGYGGGFMRWLRSGKFTPYNSWGNGSAMRVSPVGWLFGTLKETLAKAKKSADFSHNHPEGIKGAQATAAAIFMARNGAAKPEIKDYIAATFGYDLNRTVREIRPGYAFNESCQGTVPEAIIVFLESRDFTDAMQLGISIGGDTDTLCAITGGIAEAFYRNIPPEFIAFARTKLDESMLSVIDEFYARISKPSSR